MKKYIILGVMTLFLGLSTIEVNASVMAEDSKVNMLRVGLKRVSGKTLTLTTKGKYSLNNIELSSGEELRFKSSGSKIIYKGKSYDVLKLMPKQRSSRILINYGKEEHVFSGSFEVRNINGEILPINILSIEEYVEGVLPYEMSSSYPLEALKAQAVAARNYAISNLEKHKNQKFDVCDGIHCQVYKGKVKACDNIKTAVEKTSGEILKHKNDIVKAFFYSSNGGHTESSKNVWKSDYSYLISQRDEYDTYKWGKDETFTNIEIEAKLKQKGYISKNDIFKGIGKVKTNSSGRNSEIEVIYKSSNGEEKIKTLEGEEPRIVFSLKSSMFYIEYNKEKNTYTFKGRGFGHGVGMSQYGATKRAEKGHNYKEILKFYYPNTKLQSIN
ncbi:SpoIID/LytB domain-containing protein [Clostridium cylindrosporum]|uniref:SpoIID-like domain containing protein n=1 Tax=Clostridium cylindrosporum DSM 605 TaxID=1121307 RepID=A0A0J8DEG4_CLOCY|nr:SpoIID/LytB domain-containing protein [Clostridium cylindrosporum]KMT22619.1 SpoIID-like domain containing protein [Clostridium cylindrosporum DSM 605]